jgi:hypothetical protein
MSVEELAEAGITEETVTPEEWAMLLQADFADAVIINGVVYIIDYDVNKEGKITLFEKRGIDPNQVPQPSLPTTTSDFGTVILEIPLSEPKTHQINPAGSIIGALEIGIGVPVAIGCGVLTIVGVIPGVAVAEVNVIFTLALTVGAVGLLNDGIGRLSGGIGPLPPNFPFN